MKKSVKAKLALVALLCGIGMSTARAQTSTPPPTPPPTTSTEDPDGVTGTDPVPTSPNVTGIILIVLQSFM